jgi:hypothetical protein
VADIAFLQVPMKLGLELGPIVGLDDVHTKRQPAYDLVDELNRRSLVAGVVYLQHANPRAVINRRELVQSLPRAGDGHGGVGERLDGRALCQ